MIVSNEKEVFTGKVINPEAKNAFMQTLISPKEGWEGYVMRVFQLEEGGYTPKHNHAWPHINYILEGKGTLFLDNEETIIEKGSYAYVPSNELHQFKNIESETLKFICIVPEEGHK
ncbi:MAG: cupin domain-containing protein [Clostridium sp.]|uniref:cupin domain-containing protein n=1 Tax=Clostridium sp. TaxID=1506 RepID=UPI003D6D9D28